MIYPFHRGSKFSAAKIPIHTTLLTYISLTFELCFPPNTKVTLEKSIAFKSNHGMPIYVFTSC